MKTTQTDREKSQVNIQNTKEKILNENIARWIIIILTAILSVFTQVTKEPKEDERQSYKRIQNPSVSERIHTTWFSPTEHETYMELT